jgi:cytochrome c-type biogenesis protein CcmH/NrfG
MDVVTIKPNPPLNVRMLKGSAPAPPGPLTNVDVRQLQEKLDRAAALATSDVDGAIAAYRDVLSQAPALTSVHFQIATLLERKQDTAGALAAYQELARIEPTNQRALAAIARLTRQ